MKSAWQICLLSLMVIGVIVRVHAQSTAFTYHGRLNDNDTPVTGAYDMQFSVHDAEADGMLVSGPVTANALDVVNGLFRARIDFGANVFTGPARWLAIQVRPAGNGEYQTLTPRQELTSSPYSIRAQSAGTATDVSNGSVVKSLNTLKDDVTLAAGANVTIAPNGNTLTISSTGPGGSVWGLNGANAYYTAGNVGIGTSTPNAPLFVVSQTAVGADNTATFYAPVIGPHASHIHYGSSGDWFIRSAAANGKVVLQDSGGNVGIGTASPGSKLTVFSPSSLFVANYGIEHTDGTVRLSTYLDGESGWLGTISSHPLKFYTANRAASLTIDTVGNVGIGTTAPLTKLHVQGTGLVESTIVSADERAILSLNSTISAQNRVWTIENGLFGAAGLFGIFDRTRGQAGLTINSSGDVEINGNASQPRDKGGWVKAMIYVNADGTIARCYNALTGASTGNCGFQVNHDGVGNYNVLFGFQVTDRFASLTAHGYDGTFYYGPNVNGLLVYTRYTDGSGPVDSPFTLIVY